MDAHSSWGKRELNGNLAGNTGQFGRQGGIIKLGLVGGVSALEYLVLHLRPSPGFYRKLSLRQLRRRRRYRRHGDPQLWHSSLRTTSKVSAGRDASAVGGVRGRPRLD